MISGTKNGEKRKKIQKEIPLHKKCFDHLFFLLTRRSCSPESDLAEQITVFEEYRIADENTTSLGGLTGVDLNSPLDVFYAIYNQVRQF